ncbi:MAG: ClpP family protease [Chitinophagales bacterium]
MAVDQYINHNAGQMPTGGRVNPTGMTPYIIEERPMNVAQLDVFSRLMMDRIIFMGVPVTDQAANIIQAQLLFMESVDPNRDIYLYINSPGGSVIAGLGIYDTMQYIMPDVNTICTGMAASMGAVLLAAGAAGKRTCLKHSRVMIHQPMGGMQGQVSDMEISYKLIMQMRKELYDILSNHTGQTFEKIEKDSDRDYWMRAHEAKEYGIVDEVLTRSQDREEA